MKKLSLKQELVERLESLIKADEAVRNKWTPPHRCNPTCEICKDFEKLMDEQALRIMLAKDTLYRKVRKVKVPLFKQLS